jgi:pilus assembly protein CpaE
MDLIPVIIIDSNDGSRSKLKLNLENFNFINVIGDFNTLMSGYNSIIKERPAIAFIDVSENSDLALEVIEKIFMQHRSCIILVTSSENNPDMVIKALRAGAREFLPKPINMPDLSIALEKAKLLVYSEQEDSSAGKIITVFSNKGGIGKTTIASNLAVNLAEITGKRVALIDLNLQLGDVTTFLDITPSFDIAYIATHLNRIDEAFLLSSLEKYRDKELYVLADPPYLEQAEEITSEQINSILTIMKSVFSYIVIDTSSSFDSKTLCSLDASDSILLVSMINLPSIRNSQRCLDLFNRLDYNDKKIKLIINRYLPNEEITIEDVEEALGHPVYWKIPNNYFIVMSAINRGLPISKIDTNSNISQNFYELAASLSNTVLIKRKNIKNPQPREKSVTGISFIDKFFKQ